MANKLIIEIRHAAAAKAATNGNWDANAVAPEAPPNTVKPPPAPSKPPPDRNKIPEEPKPPTAQEQMDHTWSKAEAKAMAKIKAMAAKK